MDYASFIKYMPLIEINLVLYNATNPYVTINLSGTNLRYQSQTIEEDVTNVLISKLANSSIIIISYQFVGYEDTHYYILDLKEKGMR